jgi:hypothetical protein
MATKAELEAEVEELKAQASGASEPVPESLSIYERINRISKEAGALAPEAKGGVPFAFRGIDGTVAHLTPFLHKYGVFLSPETIIAQVTPNAVGQRTVKTTETLVQYNVYGPEGKSDITLVVPGLADDFADRSTAQAMSVAYRIALLQLFHLPTHTKEPEETGGAVADTIAKEAAAPARPAPGPAPATGAKVILDKIVEIAGTKGINTEALNQKGTEVSGGKPSSVWFGDASVLQEILTWVQSAPAGGE